MAKALLTKASHRLMSATVPRLAYLVLHQVGECFNVLQLIATNSDWIVLLAVPTHCLGFARIDFKTHYLTDVGKNIHSLVF